MESESQLAQAPARVDARWRCGVGLAVAAVGFIAYLATMGDGIAPGEPAALLVQVFGLFPRLTPHDPVWYNLNRLFAGLGVGAAPLLAGLGAALAAFNLWLIYDLVAVAVSHAIIAPAGIARRERGVGMLAGMVAALATGFAAPYWAAANRVDTGHLHLTLLLGAAWLLKRHALAGSFRVALFFGLLYGVGIVEFPTFVVFAPLLGGLLLYGLWRHEQLRVGRVLAIAGATLAGLLLYLLAAWQFHQSDGYVLRGYTSFFQIVWQWWRAQALTIAHGLPQVGWIVVVCLGVLPWLTALLIARRGLNEERDGGFYLLHMVMTLFATMVLLNVGLAPERLMGRALITPFVLNGMVLGYLAAYWYLLPGVWLHDTMDPAQMRLRHRIGVVACLPVVALALCAGGWNFKRADARGDRHLWLLAREIVAVAEGREWIVTDGALDNLLLLAGAQRGKVPRLINVRAGGNPTYMRYIADRLDNPALRNVAALGVLPLLQEWIAADSNLVDRLAVVNVPDVLLAAGAVAVPDRVLFVGARADAPLDLDGLMRAHEDFWVRARAQWPLDQGLGGAVRAHLSLLANNLGVLAEDRGDTNRAMRAYQSARELFPDNLSALLNLGVLADRGAAVPEVEAVRAAIAGLAKNDKKPQIWTLARMFGYVRAPEAYVQMGLTWALSGQPGLALSGLKRAMDLLPEDQRGRVKELMADMYLAQSRGEESEAIYRELLAQNPAHIGALMGMARLDMRAGRVAPAREWLDKAGRAGAPKAPLALEWGLLYLAAGDNARARITFEELTVLEPQRVQAWVLLAWSLLRLDDRDALNRCLDRLARMPDGQGLAYVLRGEMALKRREIEEARRWMDKAMPLRPRDQTIREWLVRLAMMQEQPDLAARYAVELLKLDPASPLGHQAIGLAHLRKNERALAEDSFRRALARDRSPPALNNLAWVLQERGQLPEAEKLAREALAQAPGLHHSWDTLGTILMRAGRLDEARLAFERAVRLAPSHAAVFLHLIELELKSGRLADARKTADMLWSRRAELAGDDRRRLRSLREDVAAAEARGVPPAEEQP